jgi:stage II sporulation protein B
MSQKQRKDGSAACRPSFSIFKAYLSFRTHTVKVKEMDKESVTVNKARMTFRFDTPEANRSVPGEPQWNPESETSMKTEEIHPKPVVASVQRKAQTVWQPFQEPVSPSRAFNRPAEPAPQEDKPVRRTYADMNAAISNWPEEDVGNPFQAHAGLGVHGYHEPAPEEGASYWQMAEGDEPYHPLLQTQDGLPDSGRTNAHRTVREPEPVRHRPPPRTPGWKIIGSITGAIVTGALFGMVVLSLFNKDVEFPIPGLSAISQSAQKAVESLPVVGDMKQQDTGGTAVVQITLPAQEYFFLQYGVFSSPEGVARAQQELQDAGYAAAQDKVDAKRVYAAISADREQAKLLSSEMKAEGVDLILHEAAIPSSAEVHYSLGSGTLELYARQSGELVKLLSETSASLLLEDTPKLSAQLLSDLQDKHVQFTQSAAAIRGGFSGDNKQIIQNMETEMNRAVEALLQFGKTQSKSHLWEVQSSMMRYVLDEQQLFGQN